MKDVIVTGGRIYEDAEKMKLVLDCFDIGLLIQGGAKGADAMALTYAQIRNIKTVTMKANWDLHGKAAGPIRNRTMLNAHPNAIVVAFPGGRGTDNCISEAQARNMTILRVL